MSLLPALVADQGIEVRLNETPESIVPSELAVVVAHGELGGAGRYFVGLRDGAGRYFDPDELADALSGTVVVVLLVCSGGRTEQVPHGLSTTGLTRTLLDKGVRTVIAPPWALEVYVACDWLNPFLKACETGSPVARAAYEANLALSQQYHAPTQWLAMHVFGDPTTSLSPRETA